MAMLVQLFPLWNLFFSWLSNSHPLSDQKHPPNSHNHRCVGVGWLRIGKMLRNGRQALGIRLWASFHSLRRRTESRAVDIEEEIRWAVQSGRDCDCLSIPPNLSLPHSTNKCIWKWRLSTQCVHKYWIQNTNVITNISWLKCSTLSFTHYTPKPYSRILCYYHFPRKSLKYFS